MFCPKCSSLIPDESSMCPVCGQTVIPYSMYSPVPDKNIDYATGMPKIIPDPQDEFNSFSQNSFSQNCFQNNNQFGNSANNNNQYSQNGFNNNPYANSNNGYNPNSQYSFNPNSQNGFNYNQYGNQSAANQKKKFKPVFAIIPVAAIAAILVIVFVLQFFTGINVNTFASACKDNDFLVEKASKSEIEDFSNSNYDMEEADIKAKDITSMAYAYKGSANMIYLGMKGNAAKKLLKSYDSFSNYTGKLAETFGVSVTDKKKGVKCIEVMGYYTYFGKNFVIIADPGIVEDSVISVMTDLGIE